MSWLSLQERGGGTTEDDKHHRDVPKPNKPRFWNVGALLELSADAKENAALQASSLPPTNGGRGGALTVIKPRRRFLSIPMSPPKFLLTFKSKEVEPIPAPLKHEEEKPQIATVSGVSRLFWWANIRELMHEDSGAETMEADAIVTEAKTVAADEIKETDRRELFRQGSGSDAKSDSTKKKNMSVRHQEDEERQMEEITLGATSVSEQVDVEVNIETLKEVEAVANGREITSSASAVFENGVAVEIIEEKADIVASNVNILESVEDEQAIDVGDDSEPVANLGPAVVVGESPFISSGAVSESVSWLETCEFLC